jgi:hypothetical protein
MASWGQERGARWRIDHPPWFLGLGGDVAWAHVRCGNLDVMVEKRWFELHRAASAIRFFHFERHSELAHLLIAVGNVSFAWWRDPKDGI